MPCIIKSETGVITSRRYNYRYYFDKCHCNSRPLHWGQGDITNWENGLQKGMELCEDFLAFEKESFLAPTTKSSKNHNYLFQMKVVSYYENFVSVDAWGSTYTGDAAPLTLGGRKTFDLNTGRQVTLSELFGPEYTNEIIAQAKKKIAEFVPDQSNVMIRQPNRQVKTILKLPRKDAENIEIRPKDKFIFNPDYFALKKVGRGAADVIFLLTYDEVSHRQQYEISVRVKEPGK